LFHANAAGRTDELLQYVQPKVTQEMNMSSIKEFTADEIKRALDSIGDLKAPGGDDVIKEVKHFLDGGEMPSRWNETVVVLIQKCRDLRDSKIFAILVSVM
jgi:hypothetical protein